MGRKRHGADKSYHSVEEFLLAQKGKPWKTLQWGHGGEAVESIPLVLEAIDILEKSSQYSARKLVPILNGVLDLGSSDTEASIGGMQYCRGILSRTANCMRENGCQEGCGYSC